MSNVDLKAKYEARLAVLLADDQKLDAKKAALAKKIADVRALIAEASA